MTDHYVSLPFAEDALRTNAGRICAALGALGLQLMSRETTNRTSLYMPARYLPILEKYFERESAEKVSIAEGARLDGFPRGIYYRTATMLQLGTKLTEDDRARVRQAIAMHQAGQPWYKVIRQFGNQTRPDQELAAVFNDTADEAVPQFITVMQLAKDLNASYTTLQTWIAELGIKQSSVQHIRSVSLSDADRLRERAAKFPLTRTQAGQKRIPRVTEQPGGER